MVLDHNRGDAMKLAICIFVLVIVFVASDAAKSRSSSRSRPQSSRPKTSGTRKNNKGIGSSSNTRKNTNTGTGSNTGINKNPGTGSNTGINRKPGTGSNTGTNTNTGTNGKTNPKGWTGGTNGQTGSVDKDPPVVKPGDKSKKYPTGGNVNGQFPLPNRPKTKVHSKTEIKNFNVKMAAIISVALGAYKQRHGATAFCNQRRLTSCTSTPLKSLSSQSPLLAESCRNYQTIIRCDRHCPGFFRSMQQSFKRERVSISTLCPDLKTDELTTGGGGKGDFRTNDRTLWDNDGTFNTYKGSSSALHGSVCSMLSFVIYLVLASM